MNATVRARCFDCGAAVHGTPPADWQHETEHECVPLPTNFRNAWHDGALLATLGGWDALQAKLQSVEFRDVPLEQIIVEVSGGRIRALAVVVDLDTKGEGERSCT